MTLSISSIFFNSIGNGKHDIYVTSPDSDKGVVWVGSEAKEGIWVGQIMRDFDGYFVLIYDDINGQEMTLSIDATGKHILTALKETKKMVREMILEAAGQEEEVPTKEEAAFDAFITGAQELIEGEMAHSDFLLPIFKSAERLCKMYIGATSNCFDLDKWQKVMDLVFEIGKAQDLEVYEVNELMKGHKPHSVTCRDIRMAEEAGYQESLQRMQA